jgi:hypothetical protein
MSKTFHQRLDVILRSTIDLDGVHPGQYGILTKRIEEAVLDLVAKAKPTHPETPTDAWSTGFITAIDDYHDNLIKEIKGSG